MHLHGGLFLVIVQVIDIDGVRAFKTEGDAPVARNRNRVMAFVTKADNHLDM